MKDDIVNFYVDKLGYPYTPMVTSEFHLPFEEIKLRLKNSYKLDENLNIKTILVKKFHSEFLNRGYGLNLFSEEFAEVIFFEILDTGEIVIATAPKTKETLKKLVGNNYEESLGEGYLIVNSEKRLYNLIYDIISTIDHLNHCDYIITKHSTDKETGLRLGNGIIQKRIKIRSVKYKYIYDDEHKKHTGGKHRYRYRVRGHWHTYKGKKKWLKDYVKGGNGTIFIPKEYEII